MKTKLFDQMCKKIIEGKHDTVLSAAGAKATLKNVENIAETIRAQFGQDMVESVLSYKEVKRALEQCIDYVENSKTSVTDEDHTIYYDFIASKLARAEDLIETDEELKELNL
ncbi:hypothetical protein [Shewanella cutis]|uniref:Orphan protein n=1 Tax=Shewanella cutis TaxID=2766780 RepID=A0ABS9QUI0_9GAMM|nr:hypothetical protein [Shewanella sp. PS-2]MCG9964015.1 hypothetical protein [Shewanella sp. PS-2]